MCSNYVWSILDMMTLNENQFSNHIQIYSQLLKALVAFVEWVF